MAQESDTGEKDSSSTIDVNDVETLEATYREKLAEFKKDKSNKDLRRAKTAAKRAWDEALNATQDGEQLSCRDCSQTFMFSTEEQQFYFQNGWINKPSRCKPCTERNALRLFNRSSRDAKTKNMCYAFQKGTCPYGDKCKFSHDPKGKKKDDDRDDEDGDTSGKGRKDETLKEKKEIKFIAKCKWGLNCKLKKCRFSHEPSLESDTDTTSSPMHVNGSSEICRVVKESKDNSKEKDKQGTKKKKSAVTKTITKALKRTPTKQLKMKELRKLIKTKMDKKNKNMTKDEVKVAIADAISKGSKKFKLDGKTITLIQPKTKVQNP